MKKAIWLGLILFAWAILVIGSFRGPLRIELTETEDILFTINKWTYKHFPDTELIKTKTAQLLNFGDSMGIGFVVITKKDMFFQELVEGEIAMPNLVKPPDFLKTISSFAAVKHTVGPYEVDIILIPSPTTQYETLSNIFRVCAEAWVYRISFLSYQNDGRLGLIPVFLPKDEPSIMGDDFGQLKEITIRIHDGNSRDFIQKLRLKLSGVINKKIEFVRILLKISNKAKFKKIIQVIDVLRKANLEDYVRFSVLRPSKTKPDFEINRFQGWLKMETPQDILKE